MEKPKIALVVDTYNWAFYNRAIILKEKLSKYYNIKIIPAATALENNMLQLILMVKDYDLVHFFWRRILFNLTDEDYYFKKNNINVEEFLKENFTKVAKTTCIPDQILLEKENYEKNKKAINMMDDYYVISDKLYDIYSNLEGYKKPYGIIINGVNTELYKTKNLERFKNRKKGKIILGWSGNSKWGSDILEDSKGVHTILLPTVEKLKQEGYDIELKMADKVNGIIPVEKMPDFYNSLDIYVCTAKTEGGPNPIIESMACGVPIISTDVGFVKYITGEKQHKFILEERSIECFENKIKQLYNNPELLEELSKENIVQANKFDHNNMANEFKKFFDYVLEKKRNENGK